MTNTPYTALKTIFHEPSRLAIMTTLCASPSGQSFLELKASCNLTDGNLSRHLRVLEEAEAVTIKKSFVGAKPHTQVFLAATGRQQFREYLDALHDVLSKAAQSADSEDTASDPELTGGASLAT